MTIVATAGHVDHGKTTLVRALTGVDTDRLPQEKARGLSIDLGFAYLPVPGREEPLAFIDVPGHERFIRNMISGVHTLDLALLVVAADDGPMPQTREHLAILLALGTPRALVALTKVDRVDEARRARVLHEIDELLSDTRFSGAPVFPVVGPTGEGIPQLRAALEEMSADPRPDDDDARFRLHVDRAFVLQGIGLVVTGAVVAGSLAVGDEVWVSRLQRGARVRSLRANDTEAMRARAGQRCALALAGFSRDEVQRGDVLTGQGPIPPTRRIDLFLHDRGDHAEDPLPRSGRSVMVCLGAQAVRATLSPVGTDTAAPRLARLALEAPVSAFLGDVLLLRDAGRNTLLAGGTVLDPRPPQAGPARRRQAERLRALAGVVPPTGHVALTEVVAALLSVPRDVLEVDWLHAASAVLPARINRALGESGGVLFESEGATLAVSPENASAAAEAVEATLDAWHREHPQQLGPRGSELLPLLRDWPVPLIREAIARLVSRAVLVRSGPYVRRPDHRPTLSGSDTRLWQTIAPTLDDSQDPKPPRVHELAERFGMPPADIEAFLIRASHAGLVYRVARNRFFLPRSIVALGHLARQLDDESGRTGFDAASFRTRSGLGRNLTIEVLEFLDGTGLTRRRDAVREVIGDPEDLRLSSD